METPVNAPFKEKVRIEIAKLREMTFKKKVEYIWEYYKLQILGLIFAALIASTYINTWFINPPLQDYLYVAWIGNDPPPGGLGRLGDRLSRIVINPERQQVSITSYSNTGHTMANRNLSAQFSAKLQAGDIDFIITTREGMDELVNSGFIRPISAFLEDVPELYNLVAPRLLTITYIIGEQEFTHPMAISLNFAPLFLELELGSDDLYLTIVYNTDNIYAMMKAIRVLFG